MKIFFYFFYQRTFPFRLTSDNTGRLISPPKTERERGKFEQTDPKNFREKTKIAFSLPPILIDGAWYNHPGLWCCDLPQLFFLRQLCSWPQFYSAARRATFQNLISQPGQLCPNQRSEERLASDLKHRCYLRFLSTFFIIRFYQAPSVKRLIKPNN